MRTRNSLSCLRGAGVVLAVGLLASGALAQVATRVVYSFEGEDDGGYPDTDLVRDAAGNLYGMCVSDGKFHAGTVFELVATPTGWVHQTLYSFTGGPDGGQPYGGVTLDDQGNLYGTAVIGGSGGVCVEDGCGVVFKLTNNGGTWSQTVIHDFTGGSDGFGPGGPVVFDNQGNLYGMTPTGGDFGIGIVFQLVPQPGGDWKENIIHTFTGGLDGGAASAGRLLIDDQQHVFGVATVGGEFGAGVAFELSPTASGPWDQKTLYAFKGDPDAGFPYGGLLRDAKGVLYGTTYYDGAYDLGAVYKLEQVSGTWVETVLHDFQGGSDGSGSISGLVFDAAGNLYGTTSEGGAGCNCGTIFKLAPMSTGAWRYGVVHRFTGPPDGGYAYAGLVGDGQGSFYGATVHGGADNEGAAYRFTP
jgi:uncharacterized repeat protein (TIGR03803 family)